MNDNVIEIVSLIVKKMLKDEYIDQEEIITELVDQGYELEDIDEAFALILSDENISEENIWGANENKDIIYNRIFTFSEKMYLPLKLQGLIYRLIAKNILSPEESEKLITRTVKNVYTGSIQIKDLWSTLQDIVDDKVRLESILKDIPEFNEIIEEKYKFVN
ncbi:MAG TPA: DUF494 family protein [Halanaerobiales bacterium]|nr:DUF494 family protein [Halanaerobiales bacterium]